MAIICWPDDVVLESLEICIICHRECSLNDLTAGLCNARAIQMFACNEHFWNGSELIAGWADFVGNESQSIEQAKHALTYERRGDGGSLY
jgi:hypothetical protein